MKNSLHLDKRDIFLAVFTIIFWPLISGALVGLAGIFWMIGGAQPQPGIVGWALMIIAVTASIFIAIFPAIFLWKSSKRWGPVIIYALVFILYYFVVTSASTYLNTPRYTETDRLEAVAASEFQKSLYGTWQTTYNGKHLILELKNEDGVSDDSPEAFLRKRGNGWVYFYEAGESEPLGQGQLNLYGTDKSRILWLRSNRPLAGYTDANKTLQLKGRVTVLSADQFELIVQEEVSGDVTASSVQKMILTRIK